MAMVILGTLKLSDFVAKHADARSWINHWRREVENASWQSPQDIKERYASASFLPDKIVVFNVKGNYYRLVVFVDFGRAKVLVKWIGTHAEYSKQNF